MHPVHYIKTNAEAWWRRGWGVGLPIKRSRYQKLVFLSPFPGEQDFDIIGHARVSEDTQREESSSLAHARVFCPLSFGGGNKQTV